MKKNVGTLIVLLFFASGCIDDEIAISLIPNGTQPIFTFKYVRQADVPVSIISVTIKEADTQQVVWDISSIDPWLAFEKRGDRFYPKQSGLPRDQIKPVNIDRLIFGTVPPGLKQYYPPSSAHPLAADARLKKYYPYTEEEKPMLKTITRYEINARSGAGSGRMEFTVERECRKISLTPYSKKNHAFDGENKCDSNVNSR